VYTREDLYTIAHAFLGVGRRSFGELISKYELVGERRTLPAPQRGSYKVYSRREIISWIARIKAGETEKLDTMLGYYLLRPAQ
jgi:hypothetical protein